MTIFLCENSIFLGLSGQGGLGMNGPFEGDPAFKFCMFLFFFFVSLSNISHCWCPDDMGRIAGIGVEAPRLLKRRASPGWIIVVFVFVFAVAVAV